MEKVLISVIIPTYNNGNEIINPIDSIKNQLSPDGVDVEYEIIIVDDASTPEKYEEVKSVAEKEESVNLIRSTTNGGPSVARNLGIKLASGSLISFLDADDLWPENKIRLLFPELGSPEIEIAGGKVKYRIKEGVELDLNKWEDDRQRITHVHLGALLVRRSVFDRGYLFDEELRFSEDVDWWSRIREDNIGISIIEETTLLYQIHGNNMSFNRDIHELDLLKVLHKSLLRRKKKGGNTFMPQIKDFRNRRDDLLVSIIIPLYNGSKVIGRALQSIINQTYKNFEIIVVDDGSKDNDAEWVRNNYQNVMVIQQENRGVAAARNTGINAANSDSDILAFLDQDDEWLPEKLIKQVAVLREDPYCGWVTCNQKYVWENGIERPGFMKPEIDKPHRSFVPSSLLIRKHILLSLNGFDEKLEMGNDLDLIRKLRNHKIKEANIDEVLLFKWYDGNNESYKIEEAKADIFAILRNQIKKRNEQG